MSEPTDINENNPADDKRLSELYDRASTEQPSKSADEAILAKARNEMEQSSNSSSYYPEWKQSFSIAAVIVLSVTVVLMIDKETPELMGVSEPIALKQKIMEQEAVIGQNVIEQEIKTAGKFDKKILTKTPVRMKAKEQPMKKGFIDNLTSSLAPSSETVTVMNKTIPAKPKARKKLEAHALKSDGGAARFSRPAQAPQEMTGIMSDRADEDDNEDLSCQQLAEQDCLTSAACTLKKDKGSTGYQCLPAKDHCELMFRQSEGTKQSCEAKQGCEFIPSQCYCPPSVTCVCGGGEPPLCRNQN